MYSRHLQFMFQGHNTNAKVCQQEISELTVLAQGLLAFEKSYLTTHGERTPVFRLLSMINRYIGENIDSIEADFASGDLAYQIPAKRDDGIPF